MFPMACHRTLIGLMCGQLTLIGYSIMREGFYQVRTLKCILVYLARHFIDKSYTCFLHLFLGKHCILQALVMFPLPLITIKMMDVFKTLYVNPGMCISVEKAVELDAQANVVQTFSADVYRQPVLTEPSIAEPQLRHDSNMSISESSGDSGKLV